MNTYWNDGTELYHHGVKGMAWGVRRYQNEDGSYTEEGRKHYGIGEPRKHNDDSDKVAAAAGVKFRELAELNEKKKAAERALMKNPKKFEKSAERQEYLDAMRRTRDAYEYTNALVESLADRYTDIDYDYKTESDTGEMYVQAYLKDDFGNTFISEIYLGYRAED